MGSQAKQKKRERAVKTLRNLVKGVGGVMRARKLPENPTVRRIKALEVGREAHRVTAAAKQAKAHARAVQRKKAAKAKVEGIGQTHDRHSKRRLEVKSED